MATVKSYTVGEGDMFFIDHNSDNFTIIDCQLFGDHKEWLVDELKKFSKDKGITRFISTHPDEDHIEGIEYLDAKMPIHNFYVVKNEATKPDESTAFKHYCELRDGSKAYYVFKGCSRKWMNKSDDVRETSGISILWPDTSNKYFKEALQKAKDGTAFNDISLVARYSVKNSASFMWIGDLGTDYMEKIVDDINLQKTNIVFAPHHGRKSGKLPDSWLEKLEPEIIVIGEAKQRHLHHYSGYQKITQTKAWDIVFEPSDGKVDCYASNPDYGLRDFLHDDQLGNLTNHHHTHYYIGTLKLT